MKKKRTENLSKIDESNFVIKSFKLSTKGGLTTDIKISILTQETNPVWMGAYTAALSKWR